jgi:hypothetical protein
MTYVHTPDVLTTPWSTITLPDGGDTGAAGAAAASAAYEGIANVASYAAARVGRQYVMGADYGNLGSSAVAAYGTGDYEFFSSVTNVAIGDWVVVHAHWHGVSTAAAAAEFEIGYAIGAGAKASRLESRVVFDSLGADTLPVSTIAHFQAAAAGDLKLYIRQVSPGAVQTVSSDGPWAATVQICERMDS